MSADKMMELQYQMRQNQADLASYLREMEDWESDIKRKEASLKSTASNGPEKLPPVRNSLEKKKKKKKIKQKEGSGENGAESREQKPEKKKISAYDFRSWDKFDVDKACEEIDNRKSSSGSEYETDEEWEEQRKKQQASMMKDQGNQYFKEKKYSEAIECYTSGMAADPGNALLYANRAMALLKQDKFAAAEVDCSRCIAIDPTYVKAYSRRATARMSINKIQEALEDFSSVLRLEPSNKQAASEIQKLAKLVKPPTEAKSIEVNEESGIVKPVYKPPAQRSKKPLRKVMIEEIGTDPELSKQQQAVQEIKSTQSEAKQRYTQQDEKLFEKITKSPPSEEPASASNDTESLKINIEEIYDNEEQSSSEQKCQGKSSDSDDSGKPKSNSSTPTSSPRAPGVPTSSFQFQTDYKSLKNHPQKFFHYFKEIPPTDYVKLFGEALDSDILMTIVKTLLNYYMCAGEDVFKVLMHLIDVKRFSMTAMFMSEPEKAIVQMLFDHAKSEGRHLEARINATQKKWGLK